MWQPIETAPKDRRILLYWNDIIVCGHFDDDRYANKPRPYWSNDLKMTFSATQVRRNPPSHWMELPEAPPA
jgi:hypothetical protein